MDLLWPEMEPESASNNLHKALHIARRALEPDLPAKIPSAYLHLNGEFVSLVPPGLLGIDVEEFWAALQRAQSTQDPEAYRAASRLYSGDLLPEDRYEDWAIRQREQLHLAYGALLLELARLHEQRGEAEAAIEVLQQLVRQDPANEQAQATLMRLLAQTGSRQLALRQYQQLSEALRRELDVEPDASVQQLYQRILAGEVLSTPERLSAPPLTRSVELLPQPVTSSLVGREWELGRLDELVDDLYAGRGRLVVITGEAGMGKSHLGAEVADRAARRGAITLWGAAYERRHPVPYGPIAAALEELALRLAPETLETVLGDAAAILGRLAPIIAATISNEQQNGASPDPAAIASAVLEFVIRLSEQAPVVVGLENLQLADDTTLLLLEYLAQSIRDYPILLLGAARADRETAGSRLDRLRQTLEGQQLLDAIHLAPLGISETEVLVTRLLDGPIEPAVLEVVQAVAQGNPYYVKEMVQALRGRNRIRQEDGVWCLRKGIVLRWNRDELRRRSAAPGDYRLVAHLRAR